MAALPSSAREWEFWISSILLSSFMSSVMQLTLTPVLESKKGLEERGAQLIKPA